MKIWFDFCGSWQEDEVTVGVHWYKHSARHKWKGFSFQLIFFKWILQFNWVNNYVEYRKRMDYRYSDIIANRIANRTKNAVD